ncbi:hypothetical protein M3699_16290 [Peribacillus simplex]|nr:hypothetical protein [Peribacillus simplex]MCM3675389.1 hypothetical protein [Peribacillus simplex]
MEYSIIRSFNHAKDEKAADLLKDDAFLSAASNLKTTIHDGAEINLES